MPERMPERTPERMPERALVRPSKPVTATDRVYEGIYRAVLERRLAAGAWLREEELAASFGVSRTVVRQALHRLAQHQVVELIHNRGARVPLPELADAEHVFEARRVAECEIARRLGGRLEPAQRAELRTLVEEEERAIAAGDTPRAVRLSGEFHQALARLHGNPVLVRLLDSLLPTTSVLMSRFSASGLQPCVAHRHAEVLQALERGSADAAAEMKRHLGELQRALTRDTPAPAAALRDVFAAYRERPAASASTSTSTSTSASASASASDSTSAAKRAARTNPPRAAR